MLESDGSDVKYLGKLDVGGASTLEALQLSLELNEVLEWAFDFWDVEDKRCVRKELERLNGFSREVYVIKAVAEGDGDDNKRRRLLDGSFTMGTAEHVIPLEEVVQFVEVDDLVALPIGSSQVSDSTICDEVDNNPLQSTLLSTVVTDQYLERAKRLRVECKRHEFLVEIEIGERSRVQFFPRCTSVVSPLVVGFVLRGDM